jgi:hypothetical protein
VERSEGVMDTVARIIRMKDPSNLFLLNAIDAFGGWHTETDANPKLPGAGNTRFVVVPPPEVASVALTH